MTKPILMPIKLAEIIQGELKTLHDSHGLSWAEISLRKPYNQIPPGTLQAMSKGLFPPKKYHRQLSQKPFLNQPVQKLKPTEILLAFLYREKLEAEP